ncbi:LacI family DNA-binding transcriptional regulator [Virgibacillus halophilus]|uniref:LacI family DNA-binding transcriptional regulator n=1 Tax=Tigheibacillus halophilus TaxID=361280 RepID=A0ABU5C424_9BACI|nr:LacI family DNA-binding transcriptional regulator [Virgibacillus halophilus]
MRVTIKDIAKMADVSPSAVSLVLNDRPCRVSEEKKATIKRIAKEYNYAANQIARSLVTRKSKTIGLLIPDIENIFFSSLAKHIEERCRQKGYMLIIVNSDNKYKHDLELLELLKSRSIDGLFLIPSDESYENNTELINQLRNLDNAKFPYVMIDRIFSEHPCNKVWFDNEEGANLAVSHLLESGHQKIACIANSSDSLNGKSRLTGYYRAMEKYNCEINPEFVIEGDYRMDSGFRAGKKLLNQDISAVFVTNDMMALGLLKAVYEKNMQVPNDISIISYDNTINSYIFGVELTAIEQDVCSLSNHAVRLLFSQLEKENKIPEEICLIPKLIKNTSVLTVRQ